MICDLYKARSARINKERGIGNIPQRAPLGTNFSEFLAQLL